jgi:hypothetical protein
MTDATSGFQVGLGAPARYEQTVGSLMRPFVDDLVDAVLRAAPDS